MKEMKKEEFPTFLNEQPAIIFGRTGRELLIIACGLSAAYLLWQQLRPLERGIGGILLALCVSVLPAIAAAVVALVPVACRPMEEWFVVWGLFLLTPKLYLYDEETCERVDQQMLTGEEARGWALRAAISNADDDD
jgi:hypothetical protein